MATLARTNLAIIVTRIYYIFLFWIIRTFPRMIGKIHLSLKFSVTYYEAMALLIRSKICKDCRVYAQHVTEFFSGTFILMQTLFLLLRRSQITRSTIESYAYLKVKHKSTYFHFLPVKSDNRK